MIKANSVTLLAQRATKGEDNVCYAVDHYNQAEFDRAMDADEAYEDYYEVGDFEYRVSQNAVLHRYVKAPNSSYRIAHRGELLLCHQPQRRRYVYLGITHFFSHI
jgi:hypothetical protein